MLKLAKILVPTDFSLPSQHALRYALSLAKTTHSQILLLHVVDTPAYLPMLAAEGGAIALPDLQERARGFADQHLKDMAQHEVPATVDVKTMRREGPAYVEILDVARKEGVDMIVMATQGLTGLKHFLLGSTAERVVREAPCPVLTLRAETMQSDADKMD
jgi:universal stress protein A